MDADISPLDMAEEALDMVRVDPAFGLVFLAVVDPVQRLKTVEIVVAEMLVRMQTRPLADVFPNHLPRLVGILPPDDARQGLLAPAAERVSSRSVRIAHLHQQHPGRLVLARRISQQFACEQRTQVGFGDLDEALPDDAGRRDPHRWQVRGRPYQAGEP